MKKLIVLTLVLGLLMAVSAGAEPPAGCKTARFPYARKQTKSEFQGLFDRLERKALVAHLFYELTSSQAEAKVAGPLVRYLRATETNADLRAFYETLAWSVDLSHDEMAGSHKLELGEVCAVYAGVLASIGGSQ